MNVAVTLPPLLLRTGEHQLPLNFYCATCREVICRDCMAVTHPQDLHRILETADALATLRTSAVTLLRHYTLVRSFHASLSAALEMYIADNPTMVKGGKGGCLAFLVAWGSSGVAGGLSLYCPGRKGEFDGASRSRWLDFGVGVDGLLGVPFWELDCAESWWRIVRELWAGWL